MGAAVGAKISQVMMVEEYFREASWKKGRRLDTTSDHLPWRSLDRMAMQYGSYLMSLPGNPGDLFREVVRIIKGENGDFNSSESGAWISGLLQILKQLIRLRDLLCETMVSFGNCFVF